MARAEKAAGDTGGNGATSKKASRSMSSEVKAMAALERTLEELTPAQRRRCIFIMRDRYGSLEADGTTFLGSAVTEASAEQHVSG